MKIDLDRRWIFMSGWFIAMAVLWGAGLMKLSELEYRPIAPGASAVNQLRLKLRLLDQFDYNRNEMLNGMGSYRQAAVAMPESASESGPRGREAVAPVPFKEVPVFSLPKVSGIVRITTGEGRHFYSALIEGRMYSAEDRCFNYLIESIAATGVEVSQQGRRWFIPAPEVYYSIQRSP